MLILSSVQTLAIPLTLMQKILLPKLNVVGSIPIARSNSHSPDSAWPRAGLAFHAPLA
jgi:hypothetical protein